MDPEFVAPDAFAFNQPGSFKEWITPPPPSKEDDSFMELVRLINFHYDNEGGQMIGLAKARRELLNKTTDEQLIRKAVVASQYGQDENLNLQGTFELF